MIVIKKIFAVIIALVVIGICAFLGYLFYLSSFLAQWLMITLLVLCGIGIIATIKLLSMYLSPEAKTPLSAELDEIGIESETIYSEKTVYRELK